MSTLYYSQSESKAQWKSLSNRIKTGKRFARILRNQHKDRPFTHEFVLRFNTPVDRKRFRTRISKFLSDTNIHIVWNYCVSVGGNHHYHCLVYSENTTTQHVLKRAILQAINKDKRHELNTSLINLHFERIDETRVHGLIWYTAKSTEDLLRKDQAQPVGEREWFKTGRPYTKPSEELSRLTPEQRQEALTNWLCYRPQVLTWIIDGEVDAHHKRFLWMAYSGRNVSECRPIKDAHNSTTFHPPHQTFSPKQSTSNTKTISKPSRPYKFKPRPPDMVIGRPHNQP